MSVIPTRRSLRRRTGSLLRRIRPVRSCTNLEAAVHSLMKKTEELCTAVENGQTRERFLEQQIDKLHAEVQVHKTGLLQKLQRPYVMGLVQLHDGLGRVAEHLRAASDKTYTTDEAATLLTGFQEDVELLLEQNSVRLFREPGDAFVPARQTSLQTVPASTPSDIGRIARKLRPGFELEETVVRKELVCVYGPVPADSGIEKNETL